MSWQFMNIRLTWLHIRRHLVTSWYGNAFHITDPLRGGSTAGFPRSLENSGKWSFRGKSWKSQGICQTPQGILENSKISGNSQGIFGCGRFKCCFWECCIGFICFAPSFQSSIMCGSQRIDSFDNKWRLGWQYEEWGGQIFYHILY